MSQKGCLSLLIGFLLIWNSCQICEEEQLVKTYAKFYEVPINSINPKGWLYKYLENQKNGITGHLDETGSPFNELVWANPDLRSDTADQIWWPYEQTGYWIDGMIRCGHLLKDTFLIEKARKYVYNTINNCAEDGFLGPEFLREPYKTNRWVHAVFFRALMAEYSATKNSSILNALQKHYLFDADSYPYGHVRDLVNVEEILWTYGKTGDDRLLHLAERIYQSVNEKNKNRSTSVNHFLKDEPVFEHGVTYLEPAKLGAILYMYTGEEKYLDHSVKAFEKVFKYHMLVDGVNSSSEQMRTTTEYDSHETCDIAELTYGLGYLLMATSNAEYADRIEQAIFNAAPGAVKPDFTASQYFSCPNQVVVGNNTNHNFYQKGNNAMQFAPSAWVKCCPGEVNKIMPNYISRMWMKDRNNGIVAAMYGPSEITVALGRRSKNVKIKQITDYPFSGKVTFLFEMGKSDKFNFTFRIPKWAESVKVFLNGKDIFIEDYTSGFKTIHKKFKNKDSLVLEFGQELNLVNWQTGGIVIERGPLVYSLKIKEDWQIDQTAENTTVNFPAYNLFPQSDWNYALDITRNNYKDQIKIIHNQMSDNPWSINIAPIELRIPAKKIPGWELEKFTNTLRLDDWPTHKNDTIAYWNHDTTLVQGNFVFTPKLPRQEILKRAKFSTIDTVTLVPYGCTNLRITIFPQID